MTYPVPRYRGNTGEMTASIRRATAPPDLTWPNGTTAEFLAGGAATDGLFGLYRWTMPAATAGAAPHFHRTLAESFYVLRGTVTIFDGSGWVDAGEGDFVHVPPGGRHGFRNDSAGVARMLIHFAPGAPREAYFEGLVRWSREGRPGPEEVDAFLLEHDNILV